MNTIQIGRAIIHNGFCEPYMATMPDNSVDAIITDPPYFKVKGEAWDNQWENEAEFIKWIGELCVQFKRILKPNGSLYLFATPRMAARVEVEIGKYFNVLSSISWRKSDIATGIPVVQQNKAEKEALRAFVGASERIIFAEHYGADNMAKGESGYAAECDKLRGFLFEPLRAYLKAEWDAAGLKSNDANIACGTSSMAGRHYFTMSQWQLPTQEHYESLRKYANKDGGSYLMREYEDLRRPFNLTNKDQWGDVWDFKPVPAYAGKHPCEKPQPLLQHILKASTKPDFVVFDPFAGSGSMGVACEVMGRNSILIEQCAHNFKMACANVKNAAAQQQMFD